MGQQKRRHMRPQKRRQGRRRHAVVVQNTVERSSVTKDEGAGMHFFHPCVMGSTFELIRAVEFDIQLGDEGFSLRVELFRRTKKRRSFRARIWQTERFRIQSTFPSDPRTGQPAHEPSDELILVNWETNLPRDYAEFRANSADEAFQVVLDAITKFLDHVTGRTAIATGGRRAKLGRKQDGKPRGKGGKGT